MSLLIIELGGSKFEVGAVFMTNFLAQTFRVVAAAKVDVVSKKRMLLKWYMISTILFLGLFLTSTVADTWGQRTTIWYVISVLFLQRIALNVGGAAWQPLLTEILPPVLRGRFLGRMRMMFQLSSLIVILIAGAFLGDNPPLWRFYIIFGILALGGFLRPAILLRIPERRPARAGPPEPILRNMLRPFRDRSFRRFLLFWGFVVFATNMVRPFGVPFLKQDLQFPSSLTIYSTSLFMFGMLVGFLPWGKMADRYGNRIVFLINILILSTSFLILSATPSYQRWPIVAVAIAALSFFMSGLSIGGMGIAHSVRVMHVAPSRHRGPYMSMFFMVNGLVAGFTSMLSGFLLDHLPARVSIASLELNPLRLYFPISSVLILSAVLFVRGLTPVAESSIRTVIANLLGYLPPALSAPFRARDDSRNSDRFKR